MCVLYGVPSLFGESDLKGAAAVSVTPVGAAPCVTGAAAIPACGSAFPVAAGVDSVPAVPAGAGASGAGTATSACESAFPVAVGGAVAAAAPAVPAGAAAAGALTCVTRAFRRACSPFGRSGVHGEEMTVMIFEIMPAAYGSASVQRLAKGMMSLYKSAPPGAFSNRWLSHAWHSTA